MMSEVMDILVSVRFESLPVELHNKLQVGINTNALIVNIRGDKDEDSDVLLQKFIGYLQTAKLITEEVFVTTKETKLCD